MHKGRSFLKLEIWIVRERFLLTSSFKAAAGYAGSCPPRCFVTYSDGPDQATRTGRCELKVVFQ